MSAREALGFRGALEVQDEYDFTIDDAHLVLRGERNEAHAFVAYEVAFEMKGLDDYTHPYVIRGTAYPRDAMSWSSAQLPVRFAGTARSNTAVVTFLKLELHGRTLFVAGKFDEEGQEEPFEGTLEAIPP